jgi:flagellar biosynthesis chaperone FliJ
MPEFEFEPVDRSPAALADDPVAAHARQLSNIVEVERRRRRRTLLLWSVLLLPPAALAVAALLAPAPRSTPTNFNSPEFAQTVAPIVQRNVGEQIEPVVKEQLGPQVDKVIETKVSEKVRGASPARVEELSREIKQVSDEMSQAQTGMRDLLALRNELSQVREQVGANGNSVRNLQQRVEALSNTRGGGDDGDSEGIKRLEARLADFDKRLESSVRSLQAQLDRNSAAIKSLASRLGRSNDRDYKPGPP